MTEEVTKKDLEEALDTYAALVEMYPDNEAYLQRYADMLQTLGRDATATITLQHLHDLIAERSVEEALVFAKKYPQIGRIKLEDTDFEFADKHDVAGQIIYDLLGTIWLAMHRKKLKDGQRLYRIGEQGDSLTLVLQGKVDVYTAGENDTRVLLATVKPYDVVGEQMFINPGNRVIDAFASGDCLVVALPRKKLVKLTTQNRYLDKVLVQRASFRAQIRAITQAEVFQLLPLNLRKHISRNLELRTCAAGSLVSVLNQPAHGIHVILAGEACYLAKGKNGKKFMLPPLSIGSLTGDVLLQGGEATSIAELYAKTDVTIAHLPYDTMLNISIAFPPLQERLHQHAEAQRLQLMRGFDRLKSK